MARDAQTHIQHHDSLRGLVRWIEQTKRVWRTEYSWRDKAEHSWDLNAGYKGALKLASEGWAEGASRMAKALANLPAMDSAPKSGWSVAGGSVSVGRAMSGNPLCMRSRKRVQGHRPALTLAVSVAANCHTDAQHMANYGLAIARYCEQLEQAGYPVEVVAVLAVRLNGTDRVTHSWTVKEQGQGMNLADMAFSIGHPAMFRRLGFAAMERSNVPEAPGYGSAQPIAERDLPHRYSGAILLNGIATARDHSRTPESALAALEETIGAILEQ